MKAVKSILAAASLSLLTAALAGQTLSVEAGFLYPDDQATRTALRDFIADSARILVESGTPDFDRIVYGGETWEKAPATTVPHPAAASSQDRYKLSIGVTDAGDTYLIMFTMEGPRGSAEPQYLYQRLRETSPRESAQVLGYLKAAADQFPQARLATAPNLIEELDLRELKIRNIQGAVINAYSVSVLPDSEFIIGAGSLALHFNEDFQVRNIIGENLVADGQYSGFYQAAVSRAGILYSRTATDRFVYQFLPGLSRPRRIQFAVQQPSSMAVLRDGSLLITDAYGGPAHLYSEGNSSQVNLSSGFAASILAAEAGPDGNIWAFDAVSGSIRITSPKGELIDVIIPRIPPTERSNIRALGIYQDGSFVLSGLNGLYSFSRKGELIWKLSDLPGSAGGSLASVYRAAVDSETGYIYLPIFNSTKVLRLVDQAYIQRSGILAPDRSRLRELLEATQRNPGARVYAELAHYYEEKGSFLQAKQQWNAALDEDPFFFEAEEALRRIEYADLMQQAGSTATQAITELETFGVETARARYQLAIRLFEQAAALQQDSGEASQELRQLQNRFEAAQNPNKKRYPIRIESASVQDIFPSLIYSYQDLPAGKVRVTNTQSVPVQNLRAVVRFADYMDLPRESMGPLQLQPGETAELELFISLNQKGLELDENLPIQVSLELIYEAEGEEQSVQSSFGSTLLKRSALSWDDSRKLAAFITPNEAEVSGFARRALAALDGKANPGIPASSASFLASYRSLRQAFVIVSAIGAQGLRYVEDPAGPFARGSTQMELVDTVRFPRETLFYQTGDCDDMTALLASLLEAIGIQTAILTSPGHVFLAFNSRIPASESWLLETADLKSIAHAGELWIPLESTNLHLGFIESWRHASGLVRQYQGSSNFEFLPLAEARELYPALPLPRSSFTVLPPSEREGASLLARASEALQSSLYRGKETQLTRELREAEQRGAGSSTLAARAAGRDQLVALNKLAILHDLFGQASAAEERYRRALGIDPDYLPTSVNLSSFYLRQNQAQRALEVASAADAKRPGSSVLTAIRTQALAALGRRDEAGLLYQSLAQSDPQSARQLAYLGLGEASGARASEAEQAAVYLFMAEDEE